MTEDTVTVTFQPGGFEAEISRDGNFMEASRLAGVSLESQCGGAGTCGRCRVVVISGEVAEPTESEKKLLTTTELAHGFRLACLASAAPGEHRVELYMPPVSIVHEQKFQVEGLTLESALDPPVEIIEGAVPPHGLAVDLGTSKVAMFLVNFKSGKTEESIGFMNPQFPYGEDVISRIGYAGGGTDEAKLLRDLVVDGINEHLEEMLVDRALAPEDVAGVTVVGNTAMHHLLLGLPVRQLGASPFEPATRDAIERDAREMRMGVLPSAKVYMPPVIAGFVGSDNLAAIIATRLHEEKGPCLLVDLGTNTEVALRVGGRIVCCSCASGPAFEGEALRHGMRASPGAVEMVKVGADGRLAVSTVGDVEPIGICGSGVLDAVAALKDTGALDERGRLLPGHPGVVEEDGDAAYRLAPSSAIQQGWVLVTQHDVREIQKAKGAVRAGIEMVLEHTGVSPREIRKVMLAGAFGSYIDPASAVSIAMLPPVPADRIVQVGNAAGVGARELLCSMKLRKEAEELARTIEHLELVTYPRADLFFASSMLLSEESVGDYMSKWRGV